MTKDIASLLSDVEALIGVVGREGAARARTWRRVIDRPDFTASALNLAHYLALRHRDVRPLQRPLTALGLSSLGRLESRVMPTLVAVKHALFGLLGDVPKSKAPSKDFFAGERRLADATHELLGVSKNSAPVALLVTCPTEAADDPAFMLALAVRGVEAVRINCAHDSEDHWRRMIAHLRSAEAATGRRIKVFMDVAGPKIRTGKVRMPKDRKRVHIGDVIAFAKLGELKSIAAPGGCFAAECTLEEPLRATKVGDRIFMDDGKLSATVESVETWGLLTRAVGVEGKGLKLKPEKGLNFPDCDLEIDALTEKDRADLAFIAAHADGVEFSFVQSSADIVAIQTALAQLRPDDWRKMALILKIETKRAVRNLPDMIVQAAGRQPTAIMIARGDLAVEIGFTRLAEMQEEILWLGEAASIPVIWATQVVEHLVATGTPSRGEMTDAAMAARAECVMLNKGPYLLEAIDQLRALFLRMENNQHKKTPQLRKLNSW